MDRSYLISVIVLYTLICTLSIGGLIGIFVVFRDKKKHIAIAVPILIAISLCCVAAPPLLSNLNLRPTKTPLSFASTENSTPTATKTPEWSSDLLIDREPSYWIPSQTTFSFNKLDLRYGTIYNSNIDISDGSQSKLNTLNDFGRIVSFGHEWVAKGCIDGNAERVNEVYAYVIIIDSVLNAQRYFAYNKEMDGNTETSENLVGEEFYIDQFDHSACFLPNPEVTISFRRNNVIGIVGAKSFNMNEYVLNDILEAAQLLDQSIKTEAKNNSGNPSKLEALFTYYSTRALNPQSQNNSSNSPYNAPDDYGSLSCDEGGPCDCGGADRNSSYCMGWFQHLYNEEHPVP